MPRVTSGQAARRAGSRLFPDVPEHTATAVQRAARGARVWLSQKPPRLSLARVLAPPPPPPTRARMRRTRPAAADTMVVDTNTRRAGSRARPQECRSEPADQQNVAGKGPARWRARAERLRGKSASTGTGHTHVGTLSARTQAW